MPTTFFNLPFELRDEIYKLVLVSPSSRIAPVFSHSSSSSNAPHYHLRCLRPSDSSTPPSENQTISLSLLRTNRQIYNETKSLFWESNTFYFPSPLKLRLVLKKIGQIPSRLITSAILSRPMDNKSNSLAKALSLLGSRSRHGSFRRLELEMGEEGNWGILMFMREEYSGEKGMDTYDGFLDVLRAAGEVRYEKILRVKEEERTREEKEALKECHFAWGGKAYWNEYLVWEDYRLVEGGKGGR